MCNLPEDMCSVCKAQRKPALHSMLQKVTFPSEKGGKKQAIQRVSFRQMKQPSKKRDFFFYFWMEHCIEKSRK